MWLLKPATGSLPGKTMLTLVREASRVDWIQEDIHITRNQGPPLAHTIPTSLELTSADFTIVRYLQDVAGLWRHNVTNLNARKAVNDSTLTANNNRIGHVVKWMKRYGDSLPDTAGRSAGRETHRVRDAVRDAEKKSGKPWSAKQETPAGRYRNRKTG